ncbi:hypothetical protein PIB30_009444 [Stylosanthes scabra]|uniref:Uncharacterized protein n=1 Tax=Stylosanthes scabra TaxID=79078 RepID=A0ABU6X6N9_9FABA|nr:hypothetical protein [Stylosanthes scabra]
MDGNFPNILLGYRGYLIARKSLTEILLMNKWGRHISKASEMNFNFTSSKSRERWPPATPAPISPALDGSWALPFCRRQKEMGKASVHFACVRNDVPFLWNLRRVGQSSSILIGQRRKLTH